MRSRTNPIMRAFTLIELLVVLAIIALIISIVLVAMGGVRSSVRRTQSANALRQMLVAYDSYSTDNNKNLLPGFVTAAQVTSLNLFAKRENGELMTDVDSQSYVWRLASYYSFHWQTLFLDYGNERLNSVLQTEYDAGVYGTGSLANANQLGISRIPAFGLNSIFVGGDSVHGGNIATDFSPWNLLGNEPMAATRFSEVKQPASLIVFAPCVQANTAFNPAAPFSEVEFGTPEVRAPYLTFDSGTGLWIDPQWILDNDGMVAKEAPSAAMSFNTAGGGIPIGRWGGGALPVANLDGSTTIETLTSLSNDMRRWSPKATGHFAD